MSWSATHTYVTGETVTAATFNSGIRDNTQVLFQPPGASVTVPSGGAISVQNTAFPTIATKKLSVVLWDTDTMTQAQTGRLTVNTAGVYTVHAHGQWDSNTTGSVRHLAIMWNGVQHSQHGVQPAGISANIEQDCNATIKASVGDFFEYGAGQNSNANCNIRAFTNDGTHEMFTAGWVSAG